MTATPQRWVCPRCQANNMLGVSRCFRCGSDRPFTATGASSTGGQAVSRPAPPPRSSTLPPPLTRPAAAHVVAAPLPQVGPSASKTAPWIKRNGTSVAIAAVLGGVLALMIVPFAFGHRAGNPGGARGTGSGIGSTPSILSSPLATPTGEPSVTGASGWKETPIREEKPVIHVNNQVPEDEEAATLVLQSETGRFELKLTPPSAELALPPDNYHYWLYGQGFRHTGEPDQYGNLVCRKHRLYSLILTWRRPGQRPDEDLGD